MGKHTERPFGTRLGQLFSRACGPRSRFRNRAEVTAEKALTAFHKGRQYEYFRLRLQALEEAREDHTPVTV